eukprot:TRINITY_DN11563_c0_g1_i1.p1 TRINITY_DN11563_c0_g1~~TRINITY_DN11563_c0_g1_i1.p1  ORF type:complete len:357 (+),score=117.68 TRINITY_DN11563_c0_g1_i1:550-1620(+)
MNEILKTLEALSEISNFCKTLSSNFSILLENELSLLKKISTLETKHPDDPGDLNSSNIPKFLEQIFNNSNLSSSMAQKFAAESSEYFRLQHVLTDAFKCRSILKARIDSLKADSHFDPLGSKQMMNQLEIELEEQCLMLSKLKLGTAKNEQLELLNERKRFHVAKLENLINIGLKVNILIGAHLQFISSLFKKLKNLEKKFQNIADFFTVLNQNNAKVLEEISQIEKKCTDYDLNVSETFDKKFVNSILQIIDFDETNHLKQNEVFNSLIIDEKDESSLKDFQKRIESFVNVLTKILYGFEFDNINEMNLILSLEPKFPFHKLANSLSDLKPLLIDIEKQVNMLLNERERFEESHN